MVRFSLTGANPGGSMNLDPERTPNDLDAILRDAGGLEGLAEQLGQNEPNAKAFEGWANDNEPRKRVRLWRRMRRKPAVHFSIRRFFGLFPKMAVGLALSLSLVACATEARPPPHMRPLTLTEKTALAGALSQTMLDPGATQFKWMPVAITNEPTVGYCGLVNGKNAYGGYVGFRRFYAVIGKLPDGTYGTGKIQVIEGRPVTLFGNSSTADAVADGLTEGNCKRSGYDYDNLFSSAQ